MARERTGGLAYTHSQAGRAWQAHALEIGPTDGRFQGASREPARPRCEGLSWSGLGLDGLGQGWRDLGPGYKQLMPGPVHRIRVRPSVFPASPWPASA